MPKRRPAVEVNEPSARRSPGRPPLPLERIVATALRLVDQEGADALSMRTLAQRLESGTATLYRHFANRAEVVAHVIDAVFGEIELEAGKLAPGTWQEALRLLARSMFAVLSRHPGVAQLLVGCVPRGPNAMAQRERSLTILLGSGLRPELAARAYATLARYVLGFAIQLVADGETSGTEDGDAFRALDPARFPATRAVADALPVRLEDELSFGLDLMIAGLAELRDREAGRRRSR